MEATEGLEANASVRLRVVSEATPTALSRRELEVLDHIQMGLTNRQIAQRLFVSSNTVNKHVQQVLRKLEVRNRVQAAMYARAALN
jgi:DNA-binding NarL/FixJ family response regulator